ncbi:MAG: methyltransferase domain-containing protein [Solirubrobacteraceae bacterium]
MSGSPDSAQHRQRLRHAFATQAAAFEDPRFNRVFTADAEWLLQRLPRNPDDLVLDVAAGTGHASRQLAPTVRAVVALDANDAMLAHGHAAALREGRRNIVFLGGDAAALPFPDGSFDIVICRFAVHHFEQPSVQIAEMCRCLRAGGRLVIADLVADDDPAVASVQNQLERLRDPSHIRMLSAAELAALIADNDLGDVDVEMRWLQRPLQPWLEQARAAPAAVRQIRAALTADLEAKGVPTGFSPRIVDGELQFRQTFGSCLAGGAH